MAEKHKQSPTTRGHYTVYTPEQKAEIGRYAAEHGKLKAVCAKFSEELGIDVKESTVRQFKKAYFAQLNEVKDPSQITALRGKKRGRPSKVGLAAAAAAAATSPIPPATSMPVKPELELGSTPPTTTIMVEAATASVPSVSVVDKETIAGEYEQMVGEMAISTCITVSSIKTTLL